MSNTNFALLTAEQLTVWQRDVWKAARESMFINRFLGTGNNAMIQRITDLKKSEKGARAVITLVADLEGDGVAGDRQLEGNEEAMKSYDQVIRIDQLRHANRHEGRMAEQKSVVDFRENSRDVLGFWMSDRIDQLALLALSGVSFNMKNNGVARTGSDLTNLEFAADVSAPSGNRYLVWDATNGLFSNTSNTSLVDADTPTWQMLVDMKAHAKQQYIKPLRGENGTEMYNVFMHPKAIAKLKMNPDFLQAWRHAMPRDANNPLFKGADVIYVDGLAIYEHRYVYNTLGASAPTSKWGGGSVDGSRTLLCGAQALGFADIGPARWVEKEFDYDNQPGISVGKIVGMLRPRFRSAVTNTDEDFGVMCVDHAI